MVSDTLGSWSQTLLQDRAGELCVRLEDSSWSDNGALLSLGSMVISLEWSIGSVASLEMLLNTLALGEWV